MPQFLSDAITDLENWFHVIVTGTDGSGNPVSRARIITSGLVIALVMGFVLFPLLRKVPGINDVVPK